MSELLELKGIALTNVCPGGGAAIKHIGQSGTRHNTGIHDTSNVYSASVKLVGDHPVCPHDGGPLVARRPDRMLGQRIGDN